jgi:hypothetical protein
MHWGSNSFRQSLIQAVIYSGSNTFRYWFSQALINSGSNLSRRCRMQAASSSLSSFPGVIPCRSFFLFGLAAVSHFHFPSPFYFDSRFWRFVFTSLWTELQMFSSFECRFCFSISLSVLRFGLHRIRVHRRLLRILTVMFWSNGSRAIPMLVIHSPRLKSWWDGNIHRFA